MTFLEHLTPSDEARMIRDAAARWASDISDESVRSSNGFSASRWSELTEMGWHGILSGEDEGGLDMGAAEVAILTEAMGSAKLPEPFIASSVACVGALTCLPVDEARALLAELVAGSVIAAPVSFGLPVGSDAPCPVATVQGDALVVNGDIALCEAGPDTRVFLLRAAATDTFLLRIDRDVPGLSVIPYRAIDGRHLARVVLTNVHVPAEAILGRGKQAQIAIARADALATAALCADAVGTMDKTLTLTAAYLNEREQFGRKLAAFQALRHLTADMMVEIEFTRSMAVLAAFASEGLEDPSELLDRARARICRAAKVVGETSIQLHGGMGMTDEMAIGHYFRRLNYIQAMLGQEAGALRCRAKSLGAEIATGADAALQVTQ